MSTSANVIEYRIRKNSEIVGYHRENIMCKNHFEDLLKYKPLNKHRIQSFGYDEDEEYWEGKSINLEKYLKNLIPLNSIIREYFKNE